MSTPVCEGKDLLENLALDYLGRFGGVDGDEILDPIPLPQERLPPLGEIRDRVLAATRVQNLRRGIEADDQIRSGVERVDAPAMEPVKSGLAFDPHLRLVLEDEVSIEEHNGTPVRVRPSDELSIPRLQAAIGEPQRRTNPPSSSSAAVRKCSWIDMERNAVKSQFVLEMIDEP